MAHIITDKFGTEILAADFDDYQPPAYRSALLRHPLCADPDHPGCDKCWCDIDDPDRQDSGADDCFADDEPVPYTSNKEA
jgi:hypothetical protein